MGQWPGLVGVVALVATPLPLLEMVQLFVRTNLLKYLPGVWHQVDRVRLLRQRRPLGAGRCCRCCLRRC